MADREVEFLLSTDGDVIRVRSGSATGIGEQRDWWEAIWANRERLAGTAHSHPRGLARPSQTDLTTWRGLEVGLGREMTYHVVTADEAIVVTLTEQFPSIEYAVVTIDPQEEPWWVPLLRQLSYGGAP